MQKILCFGNEYIDGDEIAKTLAKKIKTYNNFEFIIAESPNEILNIKGDLWILDVVKGIKETKLITNPNNLKLAPSLTCHDLDLGFYLKLLTETGNIKDIHIIGLPYQNNNLKELEKDIKNILDKQIS